LLKGYARVGQWVPWLFLVSVVLARYLYMAYSILLMGDSADLLFPLPTTWSAEIWGCLFTVVGFVMTFWGGYLVVETFCKFLVGLMGGSLIVAAVLSGPNPAAIVSGTLLPSLPQAEGLYSTVLIVLALIGSEVGSTANLNYSYFIYEKGWRTPAHLRQQRFDLVLGVGTLFAMGALMQIAAAATIHPLGIEPKDANDLARIFSESLGVLGLIVFALGLWGASFSTFVAGNTGGALIVTDICRNFVPGLRRSVKGEEARSDPIYRSMIIFWSFAPLYILFSGVRPVAFVLIVSALLVVVIPLLVLVLMKITNDRKLMGPYRNGWLTNSAMMVLVIVTIYLTYVHSLEFWGTLTKS
jgi:Mn2+/Fe2+ NRAMP family transporter